MNTLVQYSLEGGNATVLCLCKYFKMHCRLEVECIAGQSNRSQHLVYVTRPRPTRSKHQRRILTTVICHKDQTCKSKKEYRLLLYVTMNRRILSSLYVTMNRPIVPKKNIYYSHMSLGADFARFSVQRRILSQY